MRRLAASTHSLNNPPAMACLARPLPISPPSPLPSPSHAAAAACVRFRPRLFWSAAASSSTAGASPARESIELLGIPGVGPRNLRKLVDGGFRDIARLKQLYRDMVGSSDVKMVEFLQSSVGIIHRNHAESITSFVKESMEGELKEENKGSDMQLASDKRITFCVEGNISVGKSTFLQKIANETLELRDLVEIVPEPVSKWQDVGPDHFNVLGAFYAEPQRYAYTFQNYVFVTRLMQEKESSSGIKPLRLMERSIFSDRMVFVRAVHEANWMNGMELSIYDSWFDPVLSSLPGLVPDGFIYLRATPDTCHKRMMLRKRTEEGGVTLQYLRDLHEKHESWLLSSQHGNHRQFSISQLPCVEDHTLHPDIRDQIFYLEGNQMHSSIQRIPTLVLDCESSIDFRKDIEAKRKYALQVAEFFEFVKRMKEASSNGNINDGKSNNQQILLPCPGGSQNYLGCEGLERTKPDKNMHETMKVQSWLHVGLTKMPFAISHSAKSKHKPRSLTVSHHVVVPVNN
uniref:Deoxynucleoside kinase domain-containing protein n=1 Tax=Oryza punctata TaxID=4537 RepID=A0A0E0LJ30_ORYPU